ncbi:MAG: hypothetical protein KA365_07635 [Arenimonas sp.]|nr:hypothetical protein [Arenimonas sp.]
MRIRAALCLLILSAYFFFNVALANPMPEKYSQQAEQLIAQTKIKQPALAILAKQFNAFDAQWQELLRQQLIIRTHKNSEQLSNAIGLSLALQYAASYYQYTDNTSLDYFLQVQRRLFLQAQTDPRLCGILMNTASSRVDQQGMQPWLLEKNYRSHAAGIQKAMNLLIQSEQSPWPRTLPDNQRESFMRRTINQMANIYGADSIKNFEQMNNENSSPTNRCLALHQLYETINAQPLELRAQLLRSFFGDE